MSACLSLVSNFEFWLIKSAIWIIFVGEVIGLFRPFRYFVSAGLFALFMLVGIFGPNRSFFLPLDYWRLICVTWLLFTHLIICVKWLHYIDWVIFSSLSLLLFALFMLVGIFGPNRSFVTSGHGLLEANLHHLTPFYLFDHLCQMAPLY